MAEFFTPLRLQRSYDDSDEDSDEDDADPHAGGPPAKAPFIIPKTLHPNHPDVEWERDSLYDASKGTIGHAFSIFKVHGTPNEHTWPVRVYLATGGYGCPENHLTPDPFRRSGSYQTRRCSTS